MIIEVVGKEIEKIKGDFESYLNGLNMVGEISYSQYSELYDEGTKQIQKAYELGKSELEKENAELKKLKRECETSLCRAEYQFNYEQLTKAKEIIREFVEWANWQGNSKCPSFKSIQDKAEQFLSEVKKCGQ